MRLAVCLIGMAAMVLQGCSESGTDRDKRLVEQRGRQAGRAGI